MNNLPNAAPRRAALSAALTARANLLARFVLGLALVLVPLAAMAAPNFWITGTNQPAEGNSGTKTLDFGANLTEPSAVPVTFDLTLVPETAQPGSDYVQLGTNGTITGLTIPAGQTHLQLSIKIIGDIVQESIESFVVQASNVQGANGLGGSTARVEILDDDTPGVPTASIGDSRLAEGSNGDYVLKLPVTLSAPPAHDVTVRVSASRGSAVPEEGGDFDNYDEYITIPAGKTSAYATVNVHGDTVVEADEDFSVWLSVAGSAVPDKTWGRVILLNDDGPDAPPVLTISDASVTEGASGSKVLDFAIKLSKPSAGAVSYDLRTIAASATAGVDFVSVPSFRQTIPAGQTSAKLSVTINGDATIEADETFRADVQAITGAIPGRNVATATIVNDDFPSLSIADASVTEGNSGTKVMNFTIKLSAKSFAPVSYDLRTINASASSNAFYPDFVATSFRQTIPAGQTSATMSVTIKSDLEIENDEVFYVDAQRLSGATVGDNAATGKIINDDLPALSIRDGYRVFEGNSGTTPMQFSIMLDRPAPFPVSYDLRTIASAATAGVDYVSVPSFRQTIPAGQMSSTLTVQIKGDIAVEAEENFYVDVQHVTGAKITDNVAEGLITDDDVTGYPYLAVGSVSVPEGNSGTTQAIFRVYLSMPAISDVTFSLTTADGTATAPGDYSTIISNVNGVTIPAGQSYADIAVPVKGDIASEPNETFLLKVFDVSGALVQNAQGVGTIINDDGATLSVARFDAGGLYDDIDDGHREPQLSTKEYALLLQDAATRLCRRTDGAAVVAVDDVENRSVLAELAEATKLTCADKRAYSAVMAAGDSLGFLVQDTVPVLGKPQRDAKAKLSTLQVQGDGGAITLVLPQAVSKDPTARAAQLHDLGSRVQATLKAEPQARLVLIGGVTVPGLIDLTQRSLPKDAKLPVERVLLGPALSMEFANAKVRFAAAPGNEPPGQVLELEH